MADTNAIANRIRKLLALATDNANEHERLVALEAAQKLLDEHNLSMFDVQGEAESSTSSVQHQSLRQIKLQPWVRIIMRSVCILYNTTFFMRKHKGESYHPVVIGTPENIAVTLDIATWLIDSITKESKIVFSKQAERNSFKLGAAQRLLERVLELVSKPAENNHATAGIGTQLTVVRNALQAANQDYLKQLIPDAATFRARNLYRSNSGYSAGREYADSMSLDKQISVNPED